MSSFASKTHAKLSQFRSSRAAALESYSAQFQKFSSAALKEVGTYENVYHWANSQAKKFLELNPSCPHNNMAVAHDLRQVYASRPQREGYIHVDESHLHTSRPQRGVYVLVAENQQETLGKAEIAFLYKEFNLWYSAFEAEAEEEGGATAATRWTFQACQKLSRRTGLTMGQLEGEVSSWLEKRLSA
jgi:hypothetical protein